MGNYVNTFRDISRILEIVKFHSRSDASARTERQGFCFALPAHAYPVVSGQHHILWMAGETTSPHCLWLAETTG